MSEKRFEIIGCTVWMVDEDGEEELWNPQIVKILNKQQATISALKEENDILKQKLRKNYIANKQYEEMKRLQEKNEQLKKQLEIRTESDKYHQRMLMKWLCKDDGDGV